MNTTHTTPQLMPPPSGNLLIPERLDAWLNSSTGAALTRSNLLFAYTENLAKSAGITLASALAISLAVASAVFGPTARTRSPLGSPLPAAINVLSQGFNQSLTRAADLCLRGFVNEYDQRLEICLTRSAKGHEAALREAEHDYAEADRQLRNKRAEPGLNSSDRQAIVELEKARETARNRMWEERFLLRHRIYAEHLSSDDILLFEATSFDHSVLVRPRDGAAVIVEPDLVHDFLHAGWRGLPFEVSPVQHYAPVATNLWLGLPKETVHPGANPHLDALLATFFVADCDERPAVELADDSIQCEWDELIADVFRQRLQRKATTLTLTPDAMKVFERVCNELRAAAKDMPAASRRLLDVWPDQLLKLALLTALFAEERGSQPVVSAADMECATTVLRLLGRQQLRHHPLLQSSHPACDPEVSAVVAKLQLHGPMNTRDLSRKFHRRKVSDLEAILARGAGLGLLTFVNGNIQILTTTAPVSASACQPPDQQISPIS